MVLRFVTKKDRDNCMEKISIGIDERLFKRGTVNFEDDRCIKISEGDMNKLENQLIEYGFTEI